MHYRWQADATWRINSLFDAQNTTSISLPRNARGLSSPGTEFLEFEYAIEQSGATALTVLENEQLLAAGVELAFESSAVKQSSFANYSPLAVEVTNGSNQLLLKGMNSYRIAIFDTSWLYQSIGDPFLASSEDARLAEINFQIDLDHNGVIETLAL
jgi:hypothetical protein